MSALPRPVTPGPWLLDSSSGECGPGVVNEYGEMTPDWSREVFLAVNKDDGPALRALHDWIDERDRFRAALVEAVEEGCERYGGPPLHPHCVCWPCRAARAIEGTEP